MTSTTRLLHAHLHERHGRPMSFVIGTWLVGVWILVLLTHPASVLFFGLVFAFFFAHKVSAANVTSGSEEFLFSLPATRSDHYWSRFSFVMIPLFLGTVTSAIAIHFDLPQTLWGLIVDTGLTHPNPDVLDARHWAFLAALVPPTAFSVLHALFINARRAGSNLVLSILDVAAVAAILGIVFIILLAAKFRPIQATNTYTTATVLIGTVGLLLLVGFAAAFLGAMVYKRKPGISHGSYSGSGRSAWVAVAIALLVVFLLLFVSCFSLKAVSSRQGSAIQQQQQQAQELQIQPQQVEMYAAEPIEPSTETPQSKVQP